MIFQEPARTVVRRVRQLFIRRQRKDDVALWLEALLAVLNQVGDEACRHRLIVRGTAATEKPIDLLQYKRIKRPVLALGFNHVDMRDQQDRFLCAGAAQAHDHVALARTGRKNLDVFIRKATGLQPRRHRLGRAQCIADGIGRVDLDTFLVDLAECLNARRQNLLLGLRFRRRFSPLRRSNAACGHRRKSRTCNFQNNPAHWPILHVAAP